MVSARTCSESLPSCHIVGRNRGIIVGLIRVSQSPRDFRHGSDTDNSLDRQVGLVSEMTRKVICAELLGRNQGVSDEEGVELFKQRALP